jgi:hypothetical protein
MSILLDSCDSSAGSGLEDSTSFGKLGGSGDIGLDFGDGRGIKTTTEGRVSRNYNRTQDNDGHNGSVASIMTKTVPWAIDAFRRMRTAEKAAMKWIDFNEYRTWDGGS